MPVNEDRLGEIALVHNLTEEDREFVRDLISYVEVHLADGATANEVFKRRQAFVHYFAITS